MCRLTPASAPATPPATLALVDTNAKCAAAFIPAVEAVARARSGDPTASVKDVSMRGLSPLAAFSVCSEQKGEEGGRPASPTRAAFPRPLTPSCPPEPPVQTPPAPPTPDPPRGVHRVGNGAHWCANVGRCHNHNFVYFVVNLANRTVVQKCYHPTCRGYASVGEVLPGGACGGLA